MTFEGAGVEGEGQGHQQFMRLKSQQETNGGVIAVITRGVSPKNNTYFDDDLRSLNNPSEIQKRVQQLIHMEFEKLQRKLFMYVLRKRLQYFLPRLSLNLLIYALSCFCIFPAG